MNLKIHVIGEDTVEIPVFSIRRVELVYHDMVQITMHDDSVKELQFFPIEKAAEQAEEVYRILNSTVEITAVFIKKIN